MHMVPINTATNETPPISDEFLRERYGLTEEYKNKCPESFAKVLSWVRSAEEAFQVAREFRQDLREHLNSVEESREDSRILIAKQWEVIELQKKNAQTLRNLAKSSSEIRAMTSNIADIVSICANRIFYPIRNGLYFLTGHRDPVAVLPGENRLAIEYVPENTTSHNETPPISDASEYVPENTTSDNETPPISDEFLRERYGLTEEYKNKCPESFAKVLSLVRSTEETFQGTIELKRGLREYSNSVEALRKGNRILLAQQKELIELYKGRTQALQNLAKSSSELRAMTSNIADIVSICANRIFYPIRNGLYFLTGHGDPVAVLPGENRLAIEYVPENTTSDTDPTNQTSGNVKKKLANLLVFFTVSGGLYFLHAKEQKNW